MSWSWQDYLKTREKVSFSDLYWLPPKSSPDSSLQTVCIVNAFIVNDLTFKQVAETNFKKHFLKNKYFGTIPWLLTG